MRYYEITLSDPDTGEIWRPSTTDDNFVKGDGNAPSFSSLVTFNGKIQTNPNALQIEIDVVAAPYDESQGSSTIRVWGVGIGMIGQAADFNANPYSGKRGAKVLVKAGMQKGLPLANPAQAGTILQGEVFQSFGNWQGTNMSLDLICNSPAAREELNISWSWPKGTTLSSALLTMFRQAFADDTNIVIDPDNITVADLTLPYDEVGCYFGLSAFAEYFRKHTKKIGATIYGAGYSGVFITVGANTVYAWDNTNRRPAKQLEFTDLIGQPTWIDAGRISFKTVMRSDIALTDQIRFPTIGLGTPYVLTTPGTAFANQPARNKTIFQGAFTVVEVHHFGSFRQPDADAWVTVFCAVPTAPQSLLVPLRTPTGALA